MLKVRLNHQFSKKWPKKDFCPMYYKNSLGRNSSNFLGYFLKLNDFINSFWLNLTFTVSQKMNIYAGARNVWYGWFLAENQGNHQNFDLFMIRKKVWLNPWELSKTKNIALLQWKSIKVSYVSKFWWLLWFPAKNHPSQTFLPPV